jgi:ketosteroid isomerase-like protein
MTLNEVFARRDLDALVELLDPDVVWQGIEPPAVCRNRDEVREVFEAFLASGGTGEPEILAEVGGRTVVDPHPEPPPEFAPELHQVFTMREGVIVRIDDYPNRENAFAAVGL